MLFYEKLAMLADPSVGGAITMGTYAFDAFISYSHKADGKLAGKLQEALGRIARPWYKRRALRVFRDETTLSATPELWPTIQRALNQSRYFILLASPDAAASQWVRQEISYWLAQERPGEKPAHERLLIALTGGRVVWDPNADGGGDFDWSATDALPPALKGAFRSEPLYVDYTWAIDPSLLSPKHKPWFNGAARLAAAIRDIPLDRLIGEDIRQHRIALGSAAGAGMLVLLLGSAALWTWRTADVLITEKRHQMDAERVLPQLAGSLERIRHLATREIRIEFDPDSYFTPQPKILELRLELDPLFTQPMSIFFAPFREGRTWPAEFGFEESPYTAFSHGRARVDAKFRWFDRVEDLNQAIDGTDTGTTPAFSLQFDGKDFLPGGPGIHLRQQFEIPSLQELIDKQVRFRLIQHDPVLERASEVDPQRGGLDLRVTAFHRDAGSVTWLVLFDARQTKLEKTVAAGDYLVNRGPIERTVLLNLYPPIQADRTARVAAEREALRRLLETRDPKTDDDRRLLARGLTQSATLSAFRGQNQAALNDYLDAVKLLRPLVVGPTVHPRRADGESLFHTELQLVAYFLQVKNFQRAREYLPDLSLIADKMSAADPSEPDYLRWRAEAFLRRALVSLGDGSQEEAATALSAYVDLLQEVHEKVGNPTTRKDLADAVNRALQMASRLPSGTIPVDSWGELARDLRLEPQEAGRSK